MTEEDKEKIQIANEKDLLYLLIMDTKGTRFKTLQVKPEYLSNKGNNILTELLNSFNKNGSVSLVDLDFKGFKQDDIVDIINNPSSRIVTPSVDYVKIQIELIESYKRRMLRELSLMALNKSIKAKDWFTRLESVKNLEYKMDSTYLTEKEIEASIKDSQNIIELPKFEKLNKALKLCKGDLLTIGASSGLGKTSLMLNLQNSLMEKYHCIYINLEMSEPTLIKRMISINTGVEFNYVSRPRTETENDLVQAGVRTLNDARITLVNGANTIEKIENTIKCETNEKRHSIVFIDHLGLIQGTGKSIYERTTITAQKLRTLCIKYGVTIIVASQLSRTGQNQDEPDITSFKDSGEIENSSRKAMILYPENKETQSDPLNFKPVINLKIVKNDTGMLMTIPLIFEKKTQKFEELK